MVLPRVPKFEAKRDFYEYYQDYYHCANPDAGDVQILQPAFVAHTGNGWTLAATGLLEVVTQQPKQRPVVVQPPVVQQQPVIKHEEPAPAPAPKKEQPGARACTDCGALIEAKYAFCWKCGSAMENEQHSSVPKPRKPPTLL